MENSKQKRYKKIGFVLIGVLLIAIICIVVFALKGKKEPVVEETTTTSNYRYITVDGNEYSFNTSQKMILFLGIDTTDTSSNQGQSDVIELIMMDQSTQKIKILSLSRDTMVDIKMFDITGKELGWANQHLALAYAYGKNPDSGCLLTIDAISRMFGEIPIINYASFNIDAISSLQDIVGTLTITLSEDFTDIDQTWTDGSTISINSSDAEKFLRSRNTDASFSNSHRMNRQKIYLEAYLEKLKELLREDFNTTVEKLYSLYTRSTTNISLDEISDYANMLLTYQFDPETSFYTLEGENIEGQYHDEYIVNDEALEKLKIELFYSRGE